MLTCYCDSCGEEVPRHYRASVQVRMGKTEFKFELCEACQYRAIRFFEEMVGYEVLNVSREIWTEQERAVFRSKQGEEMIAS